MLATKGHSQSAALKPKHEVKHTSQASIRNEVSEAHCDGRVVYELVGLKGLEGKEKGKQKKRDFSRVASAPRWTPGSLVNAAAGAELGRRGATVELSRSVMILLLRFPEYISDGNLGLISITPWRPDYLSPLAAGFCGSPT